METRVKVLGHPFHPVLIVFPLGLFTTAAIFDIIYLITGNPIFPIISFWDIAVGEIGALLAATFGWIDWAGLPKGSRAKSVGLFHAVGNHTLVVLLIVSWLMRLFQPGYVPTTLTLIFSFVGAGIILVSGWLGGELVSRLGVGADRGANVNAPSSLTSPPAVSRSTDLGGAVAGRGSGDFTAHPEQDEEVDLTEYREEARPSIRPNPKMV